MKTLKTSLIATAIATGVGFGAWEFGLVQRIWPAHPQMADFLLTLFTAIALQIAWPKLVHESGKQG